MLENVKTMSNEFIMIKFSAEDKIDDAATQSFHRTAKFDDGRSSHLKNEVKRRLNVDLATYRGTANKDNLRLAN